MLRPLVMLAVIFIMAYYVIKKIKRTEISEERREVLETELFKIEETLKLSKEVPEFKTKALEDAQKRITSVLKKGEDL